MPADRHRVRLSHKAWAMLALFIFIASLSEEALPSRPMCRIALDMGFKNRGAPFRRQQAPLPGWIDGLPRVCFQ